MSTEPMNDDDIYIDDVLDFTPKSTLSCKMILHNKQDAVLVDRDLLLQMARLCGEIRMVELMDMFTIDEARAFRERCEQILREHEG